MNQPLSEEEFKKALPAQVRKAVNSNLINGINKVLAEPDSLDFLRENILGYTSVMRDGRFKITSYLNAVHYVSYKLLNCTNIEAYRKTFPGKYNRFIKQGVSSKDIASYCTAYNKSKLVNLIFEQTLVPTHVLNAPVYQEAINTLAVLMRDARSEKVRADSAASILTHLKRPEAQKIELDIGIKKDKTLDDLRATTLELVNQQKEALRNGTFNAKQIAEKPIITIEA